MNKKILSVVLILCVMLAVMPMTAYAADIAFCSKCNRIQTVRLTYQYSNDEWHICNVTCTVCNNIWFYGIVAFFVIHGADPFAVKELALVYLAIFVLMYIAGPGNYSVDRLIAKRIGGGK